MACDCCARAVQTPFHHDNRQENGGGSYDYCWDCYHAGCGNPADSCELPTKPEEADMSDEDLEAQMRALLAEGPALVEKADKVLDALAESDVLSTSLGLQSAAQGLADFGQELYDGMQSAVQTPVENVAEPEGEGWFDAKLLWQCLDEVDATGDIENDPNAREQLLEQGFVQQAHDDETNADYLALTKVGQEFYDRGYPADGNEELTEEEALQVLRGVADSGAAENITFQDILGMIDPRDSESALLMYDWLCETGRLVKVATLMGDGGGYLHRYREPKGTSNAGYVPGGTKGGRMVDQALDKAKEAGIKPVKRGLCDRCYNAVIQQEDGQVVLNDDSKSPVCPATGGDHSFAG